MDPQELLEMAETYRMLIGLNPQQVRKIAALAERKQYFTGQIIVREGDQSPYFHLIVSGDVALEHLTPNKAVLVQTLHHTDAMGWSALMDDARAHFQARALSAVSTVAFSGEDLRAACAHDHTLGYLVMKRLLEVVSERLDAARTANHTKAAIR